MRDKIRKGKGEADTANKVLIFKVLFQSLVAFTKASFYALIFIFPIILSSVIG